MQCPRGSTYSSFVDQDGRMEDLAWIIAGLPLPASAIGLNYVDKVEYLGISNWLLRHTLSMPRMSTEAGRRQWMYFPNVVGRQVCFRRSFNFLYFHLFSIFVD